MKDTAQIGGLDAKFVANHIIVFLVEKDAAKKPLVSCGQLAQNSRHQHPAFVERCPKFRTWRMINGILDVLGQLAVARIGAQEFQ
jgi:hypothetical protein